MTDHPINILYICGWGRSGSTIVERMLGQLPGFISVGELRSIWDRNLLEGHPCSCRLPLSDCPQWSGILQELLPDNKPEVIRDMVRLRDQFTRTRHLGKLLFPFIRTSLSDYKYYSKTTEKLYRSVINFTGADFIVDSSKYPSYALFLQSIPGIQVYLLHLVRDPRGVAYSWKKQTLQPVGNGRKAMETHSTISSSLIWSVWNVTASMLLRKKVSHYTLLRYEDLVKYPERELIRVLKAMKVTVRKEDLSFIERTSITLEEHHSVSGNPNRFTRGRIELQEDLEWTKQLSSKDKLIVNILTSGLLHRYGYSCQMPGGE